MKNYEKRQNLDSNLFRRCQNFWQSVHYYPQHISLKILNKLSEINTIFFKNGCCFSKIINKEQWRYPGISITKGLKNSSEDDVASFHVELPSHFLNAISEWPSKNLPCHYLLRPRILGSELSKKNYSSAGATERSINQLPIENNLVSAWSSLQISFTSQVTILKTTAIILRISLFVVDGASYKR